MLLCVDERMFYGGESELIFIISLRYREVAIETGSEKDGICFSRLNLVRTERAEDY